MWKRTSELPTEPGDYCINPVVVTEDCVSMGGEEWWSFDGKVWLNGFISDVREWSISSREPLGSINYEYRNHSYADNSLIARLAKLKESKDALDSTK